MGLVALMAAIALGGALQVGTAASSLNRGKCHLTLHGLGAGSHGDGLSFRHGDEALRRVALLWDARPGSLGVVPANEPPPPDVLLNTARGLLGTPYVWGGIGIKGLDCSGFVNKVYALHGYDIPRVSRKQFQVGIKVPKDQLAEGDLIFFTKDPGQTDFEKISHVGIFYDSSDQTFIHAAMGKGQVTYDRLTSRYYKARFFGARRFLLLPPGKYSNKWGGAAEGKLVEWEEGTANFRRRYDATSGGGSSSSGGPRGRAGLTDEHDGQERPLQLGTGFLKGAVGDVGLHAPMSEETSAGLRLGLGTMNEQYAAVLVPEFTYFDHGSALEVKLGIPFAVPMGEGIGAEKSFSDGWNEVADYSKILRSVRFGHKEAELYLELSRTLSGSLGHGQLMRFYTPNIATRHLPNYVIDPNDLSLAFDHYRDFGGFEIFIDDVISPAVMGTLVFVRPWVLASNSNEHLRRISTALSYVTDVKAPLQRDTEGELARQSVHGVGSSTEFKFYKDEDLDLKTYVDVSGLFSSGVSGVGGALGLLIRSNIERGNVHILRGRLEMRASSPTYIPSYFDTTYSMGRYRAPVDQPGEAELTKLKLLDELQGTPSRYGFYAEATYQLQRRFSASLSYEDGGTFGELARSERYSGRNFMAVVRLQNFYFPNTTRPLNAYFAYHLRNVNDFSGLLTLKRPNEYIFSSLTYRITQFIELSASIRKGINENINQEAAVVDAMLGAAFRYEI